MGLPNDRIAVVFAGQCCVVQAALSGNKAIARHLLSILVGEVRVAELG
jgi:hypothetical protein